MLFLLQSVLPVRGVYIHVSHKERATIRGLSMKDNEEHRTVALFRQKGFAGISDIIA